MQVTMPESSSDDGLYLPTEYPLFWSLVCSCNLWPLLNLCRRRYTRSLTDKEIRHGISPCGCCFKFSFRVLTVTSGSHEWCELSAKEISEAAFRAPWTLTSRHSKLGIMVDFWREKVPRLFNTPQFTQLMR